MAGKISKINWLYIVVIIAFLTIGGIVWKAADNYEISNSNSLLGSLNGYKMPVIKNVIKGFDLDFYEESKDAKGEPIILGSLEMRQCCIPGSTGAKEHLLQLSLLKSSFAGVDRLKELRLSVSGYCMIGDAAADIASTVLKAESLLGTTSSEQTLQDAISRALVIAHYDSLSGIVNGPQYFLVDLPGRPGFTLMVDVEALEIDLVWPAALPSARNQAEVAAKYDSIAESDKLGIEAVLNVNYNALLLENEEAAEEAGCGTDHGSGVT